MGVERNCSTETLSTIFTNLSKERKNPCNLCGADKGDKHVHTSTSPLIKGQGNRKEKVYKLGVGWYTNYDHFLHHYFVIFSLHKVNLTHHNSSPSMRCFLPHPLLYDLFSPFLFSPLTLKRRGSAWQFYHP